MMRGRSRISGAQASRSRQRIRSLDQARAYIDDPTPANLTERPTAAFSVLDEILEWLASGGDSARETVLKVLVIPERTLGCCPGRATSW